MVRLRGRLGAGVSGVTLVDLRAPDGAIGVDGKPD